METTLNQIKENNLEIDQSTKDLVANVSKNNGKTNNNNASSKRKFKHDRNGRKRSKSFSGGGLGKIINMKPVLPSKFLLGGNINDPLNLNSLQDEEINRAMNAVTPKSSPIPTPPRRKGQIEVIIPPNIHDPLNLIDCADDAEYELQLYSPIKKGRKKRFKKRRTLSVTIDSTSSTTTAAIATATATVTATAKSIATVKSTAIAIAATTTATTVATIAKTATTITAAAAAAATTTTTTTTTAAAEATTTITTTTTTTVKAAVAVTASLNTVTLNSVPKFDGQAKTPETLTDSAKIPILNESETKSSLLLDLTSSSASPKKDKSNKRKTEDHVNNAKKFKYAMDKIVSPVVPQPGGWLKRTNSINKRHIPRQNNNENQEMPKFKEKNKKFQYGNYNRYYGYRNPNSEIDHRLRVFSHHRYLFEGKDILDIGCNIGHITLSIARDFNIKTITGIDIDSNLIGIARKNIKHYVKSCIESPKNVIDNVDNKNNIKNSTNVILNNKKSSEFFPISMPILYGPIDIPGFDDDTQPGSDFPNNVTFKQCNYVLEDDALLSLEQPQFDVILCLSTTKWIHLNWGDTGIKQAFRRMYAQLRPGGKLILEPQNWASYKTKRKLTETIYKNYNKIEFFPEKFTEYLLSSVVGFAKSEILGFPYHHSKGFRRPIQVFTKSTMFPSERIEATPNNNITPSNTTDILIINEIKEEKIVAKTENKESHTIIPITEKIEHVYTNILNRYCSSTNSSTNEEHIITTSDCNKNNDNNCNDQAVKNGANNGDDNTKLCDKFLQQENNFENTGGDNT